MKKAKNKVLSTIAITIFLMTIMGGSLVVVEPVKGALPPLSYDRTYAFMDVAPNPVGVGQSVFINAWLIEFDPLTSVANGQVWQGFQITVTAPDKTTTKLGPYAASAAATIGVSYTPTEVGNYTFSFNFPGQLTSSATAGINIQFEPSNATTTITVQSQSIIGLSQTPLPTSYWTTPVYWTNQEWASISGNWYGDINQWEMTDTGAATGYGYNEYTEAPMTSHIMWTAPDGYAFGGQIGGNLTNDLSNYYTGKSYEQFFNPPVIINGIMYYNKPTGIPPYYGTYAVNLRTGQQLFYMNITGGSSAAWGGILFGQVYSWHNPNEVGGVAYLWGQAGSTMSLYDATTGEWILNIVGMVSGTQVQGPNGEILSYGIQAINQTYGRLWMWNSTKCLWAASENVNVWEYRPLTGGYSLPWTAGVQFNVTVPIFSEMTTSPSITVQYVDDGMVLAVGTVPSGQPQTWQWEAGYSASTGALIWDANRTIGTPPQNEISGTSGGWDETAANGIYIEHDKETGTYYAFNIHTGAQVWGPTVPDTNPWDSDARDSVSDGTMVYIEGAGSLRAFNLTNGALLWTFTPPPAGLQMPTSDYLMEGVNQLTVGGGLIFTGTDASHGDQLFDGAQFYAINATTGKVVWNIDGFIAQGHAGSNPVDDGYYVAFNGYDNQLYCFGQGPSKTTISAPQIGVTTATPITITGSVTDIAAGSQQNAVQANFPNGLPCVSDASMSQFMEAVYQQQPMPNNVTGVPVTFSVIDSNGNYRTIGSTTSNALGDYSFTWTPDITGNYTVYATFAGTQAYYGSSASIGFYASLPAATAAPTASPLSGLASTSTVMLGVAAIIVVMIVGIVALALIMLRKRP
jgi:outer membrane protein assembly factor BamB